MNEINKIQIEYIKVDDLIPYENNPRNNDEAVEYVMRSIDKVGFKVPMVVDKNNVIVTGHTRLKAAKLLGYDEVPCIRADDLSDEEIKLFRIADNRVSEFATWDYEKLDLELEELAELNVDMSEFGFDFSTFLDEELEDPLADDPEDEDGYYGDERERTNKAYNMDITDPDNLTEDFWQMPIIWNENFIPDDLIGFNYALSSDKKSCGIHFYVDDYQFERIWNDPEKYLETLKEYECILSPDFSLYMDMTMPVKIWNVYRSRLIGAYYQSRGIKVIPTISWAEEETYAFCFKGIPEGSIVSISTIGVKRSSEALKIWKDGVKEMIEQIKPSAILIYGGKIDYDFGDIKTVYYDNKVTENWKMED